MKGKTMFQHIIAGIITAVSIPLLYKGIENLIGLPMRKRDLDLDDIEDDFEFDDED